MLRTLLKLLAVAPPKTPRDGEVERGAPSRRACPVCGREGDRAEWRPRLRVAVVTDRARPRRGVFWCESLRRIADRTPTVHEAYPLAERIGDEFFLNRFQAVVVNWDAINGDVDFGADVALRWFQHRRLEILDWVARGHVLIVRGQATAGVPDKRAYDAVAGPGELALSGVENPLDVRAQDRRNGNRCRVTAQGRGSFLGHLNKIEADPCDLPTFDEAFPREAGRVVSPSLRNWRWTLYRGWFRKKLGKQALPWVPLVETADRGWGRNHPTLLGAAYGKGAIFVTTMFLAGGGQEGLVQALLGARASDVPAPRRVTTFLRRFLLPQLVPIFVAVVGGGLVALGTSGDGPFVRTGLAVLGALVLAAAGLLLKRLWKFAREVAGL